MSTKADKYMKTTDFVRIITETRKAIRSVLGEVERRTGAVEDQQMLIIQYVDIVLQALCATAKGRTEDDAVERVNKAIDERVASGVLVDVSMGAQKNGARN